MNQLIEKHETAIRLLELINLCEKLKETAEDMKRTWYPLYQEKANHNIQIHEGCILRFWERYHKTLNSKRLMPNKLHYRGMTIEMHPYDLGWYFFDEQNYDGEPVTTGKSLTEIKSLIDEFYLEQEVQS